ncbi:uncharacterized protein [Antedon mediterranea]|uniref:uncharacterized protein isoform X2 n=1 Tax=Antedon mediterranea TaxID=105859 RepID=UPI003AF5CA4F
MDFDLTQAIPLSDVESDGTDDLEESKHPVAFIKAVKQKGIPETSYPIYNGVNLIGRGETANVCIPLKALSKEHACIEADGDSFIIYDKASRNKTRRGKKFLKPNVGYELKDKDLLTFGDVKCEFLINHNKKDGAIESDSDSEQSECLLENANLILNTGQQSDVDDSASKKKATLVEASGSDTDDEAGMPVLDSSKCVPDSQPILNISSIHNSPFCSLHLSKIDETINSEADDTETQMYDDHNKNEACISEAKTLKYSDTGIDDTENVEPTQTYSITEAATQKETDKDIATVADEAATQRYGDEETDEEGEVKGLATALTQAYASKAATQRYGDVEETDEEVDLAGLATAPTQAYVAEAATQRYDDEETDEEGEVKGLATAATQAYASEAATQRYGDVEETDEEGDLAGLATAATQAYADEAATQRYGDVEEADEEEDVKGLAIAATQAYAAEAATQRYGDVEETNEEEEAEGLTTAATQAYADEAATQRYADETDEKADREDNPTLANDTTREDNDVAPTLAYDTTQEDNDVAPTLAYDTTQEDNDVAPTLAYDTTQEDNDVAPTLAYDTTQEDNDVAPTFAHDDDDDAAVSHGDKISKTHEVAETQVFGKGDEVAETQVFGKDDEVAETRVFGKDDEVAETQVFGKDDEVVETQVFGKDDKVAETQVFGKDDEVAETQVLGKDDKVAETQVFGKDDEVAETQVFGKDENTNSTEVIATGETQVPDSQDTMEAEIESLLFKVPGKSALASPHKKDHQRRTVEFAVPPKSSVSRKSKRKVQIEEEDCGTTENKQITVPAKSSARSKKQKVPQIAEEQRETPENEQVPPRSSARKSKRKVPQIAEEQSETPENKQVMTIPPRSSARKSKRKAQIEEEEDEKEEERETTENKPVPPRSSAWKSKRKAQIEEEEDEKEEDKKVEEEEQSETTENNQVPPRSSARKSKRKFPQFAEEQSETLENKQVPPRSSARKSKRKAQIEEEEESETPENKQVPPRSSARKSKRKAQIEEEEESETPEKKQITTPKKSRSTVPDEMPYTPSLRRNRTSVCPPKIMFTGVVDEAWEKIVKDVGGVSATSIEDCTHLITDKMRRTVKFLCGLAKGAYILSPNWLEESKRMKNFVNPDRFIVKDDTSEKRYGFNLKESMKKALNKRLFDELKIYVTPNVKPDKMQMKDIIKCAGGQFASRMPAKYDEKVVVVACEEDETKCSSALKAGIPVVEAEFILTGVLRQEVDIEQYRLFTSTSHNKPTTSKKRK